MDDGVHGAARRNRIKRCKFDQKANEKVVILRLLDAVQCNGVGD
jgi:hypothetical protein